jgi:hypothetical protein
MDMGTPGGHNTCRITKIGSVNHHNHAPYDARTELVVMSVKARIKTQKTEHQTTEV